MGRGVSGWLTLNGVFVLESGGVWGLLDRRPDEVGERRENPEFLRASR